MANRCGNNGNSYRLYFLGLQNHCRWWLQLWNSKILVPWKKNYDRPRLHIKKRRRHFADRSPYSQSYDFSCSHVHMLELDHKEGWVPKNWCFQTVVLEKTLENPLDCKEIKAVNPKGNQLWIFIGRTDIEAEAPVLWPPDVKSRLTGKDPDAGNVWRQREKRAAEDEMVQWHHRINGHEFEQTLGDSEGQGSLSCCRPRAPRVGNNLASNNSILEELPKWKKRWEKVLIVKIRNKVSLLANAMTVYIENSKGKAKECSNYGTIALISHTSEVMLKILQARLQQYVNHELPDIQAHFRKGRRTRDQIANIRWMIEKAREFQKNIYFCFIDSAKAFDCVDHNKLWKILKEMGIADHLTCRLRNLYAGQEATVRTGHGTTD